MICFQDVDQGDGLQMWKIAASEKSGSSTMEANNSLQLNISMLTLIWGPAAGSCNYSNEFLRSVRGVKFLE